MWVLLYASTENGTLDFPRIVAASQDDMEGEEKMQSQLQEDYSKRIAELTDGMTEDEIHDYFNSDRHTYTQKSSNMGRIMTENRQETWKIMRII